MGGTTTSRFARILFAASLLITFVCLDEKPSHAQAVGGWPQIELASTLTGFTNPVHIAHAGDGSKRLFVSEQTGRILVVKNGQVLTTPFLDLRSKVSTGGGALVGVAFPPGYAGKGYFYVKYQIDPSCDVILARYRLTSNPDIVDANSEEIILQIAPAAPPQCGHQGGVPAFSPRDGYLYVSTGDGTYDGDPGNFAQSPDSLLGKMLRIDTESAVPDGSPVKYNIPSTNPFVNTGGYRKEIWSIGFRNPWRFSFDRSTADLYIGDIGQKAYEEVDFQTADSSGGENYGWRTMEGPQCYPADNQCNTNGLTLPVVEYDHTQGCSVTGGMVYRGIAYPSMQGIYFYGDYCTGTIWGLRRNAGVWEDTTLAATDYAIVSFGEDEDGNVYVIDRGVDGGFGRISKLIDPAVTPPAAPDNLEATPVSSTRIDLRWADKSHNENGFYIERSTDGSNFALADSVGAGITTYSDTGLRANKRYYYRVRAHNQVGNSGYSKVAVARTLRK